MSELEAPEWPLTDAEGGHNARAGSPPSGGGLLQMPSIEGPDAHQGIGGAPSYEHLFQASHLDCCMREGRRPGLPLSDPTQVPLGGGFAHAHAQADAQHGGAQFPEHHFFDVSSPPFTDYTCGGLRAATDRPADSPPPFQDFAAAHEHPPMQGGFYGDGSGALAALDHRTPGVLVDQVAYPPPLDWTHEPPLPCPLSGLHRGPCCHIPAPHGPPPTCHVHCCAPHVPSHFPSPAFPCTAHPSPYLLRRPHASFSAHSHGSFCHKHQHCHHSYPCCAPPAPPPQHSFAPSSPFEPVSRNWHRPGLYQGEEGHEGEEEEGAYSHPSGYVVRGAGEAGPYHVLGRRERVGHDRSRRREAARPLWQ